MAHAAHQGTPKPRRTGQVSCETSQALQPLQSLPVCEVCPCKLWPGCDVRKWKRETLPSLISYLRLKLKEKGIICPFHTQHVHTTSHRVAQDREVKHSLGSSFFLNPGCGKQVENARYQNQEHRAEALHGVPGQGQQKNLQECDQVRMPQVPGSAHLTR